MAEPLIPISTIKYKQYVKEALVEALRAVFATHPDGILRKTHVGIDFPLTEVEYPSIVVRFFERDIRNAGVAHSEWLEKTDSNGVGTGRFVQYKHYLYNGDIEFAVYALSSYDRDLLADSLVQTLTMGDMETYTNAFLDRIYSPDPAVEPTSLDHMINLNTDRIQGFGETQTPVPWGAEDQLIYNTSYRIAIFGEFYSRTINPAQVDYGMVERVDTFPYNPDVGEPVPTPGWAGPDGVYGTADDQPDPGEWEPTDSAAEEHPITTALERLTSPDLIPKGS